MKPGILLASLLEVRDLLARQADLLNALPPHIVI